MNLISLTDLIRPVGSVYFSSITGSFNPINLFGGSGVNSGTINVNGEVYNVGHRMD